MAMRIAMRVHIGMGIGKGTRIGRGREIGRNMAGRSGRGLCSRVRRRWARGRWWSPSRCLHVRGHFHILYSPTHTPPFFSAAVDQDDMYYDGAHPFGTGDATDPEFEDDADSRARRPPVNFVYDAVAERSRQIQQQLEMQKAAAALTLNPVGSAH